MKRIPSNQSKAFELKSALRRYSEGGYVYAPRNDGRPNSFDSTSTLPKDPTSGFTGMASPLSSAAQQNIDMYNRMSASMRPAEPAPATPAPAAPGLPAAAPTAAPATPASPAMPTMIFAGGGTKAMMAAMDKMKQLQQPQQKPPEDFRYRFARGGEVEGPGGPTDDRVPAMLSDGEFVLPAKTVEALGGAEAINRLVLRTNGKLPIPKMVNGVPHGPFGFDVNDAARRMGNWFSNENIDDVSRAAGEKMRAGMNWAKDKAGAFSEGMDGVKSTKYVDPKMRATPDGMTNEQWAKNRRSTEDILRNRAGPREGVGETIKKGYNKVVDAAGNLVDDVKTRSTSSYKYGKDVAKALKSGGVRTLIGRAGGAASGIAEFLDEEQNAFFADPNVETGAKLRQLGRIGTRTLGGMAGAGLGGTVGSVVPVAGTVTGAVAGGYAGQRGGDALGEAIFGDPMKERSGQAQAAPVPRIIEKVVNGGGGGQKPPPDFNSLPKGDPSYDLKELKSANAQIAMRAQPPAAQQPAAAADELSPEELAMLQEERAARAREGNLLGYARESALRKQMMEDQAQRDFNPGTGMAEVMPETDMFGQTAAQRSADMDRFNARVALSRVGHGAKRRYAEAQLGAAEGYNKLADDTLKGEAAQVAAKKEMMTGHLARQSALRAEGMKTAAEYQKGTDLREASKYRDDQGLRGDIVKSNAVVDAARYNAAGDMSKASAVSRAAAAKQASEDDNKGNEALMSAYKAKFGDMEKDPEARQAYNDHSTLLTGTMAKMGIPPRLLNDPRIRNQLLYATDKAIKVRDSEKTLMAAIRGFLDPEKVEMKDSPIGSDYYPVKLGPQRALHRNVRTNAGDASQSAFEGGGILDFALNRKLRDKPFLDWVREQPGYNDK